MTPEILAGFAASLAAGLATFVGALPILAIGRPSEAQQTWMLGFAAGVMLAASLFSLILPGFAAALDQGHGTPAAAAIVAVAVFLGALSIAQLKGLIPTLDHVDLGPAGVAAARFRRIWLFVAAITLHNFPEGLAVGVNFGAGEFAAGTATAIGIGIQNLPEGLAVAGALATLGYSRRLALLAALVSGLVEPVAGLAGAALVAAALPLLPWALGFAAGAMIYVVASEVVPDLAERLQLRRAMPGLAVGLVAMSLLDTTLG